MNCPKCGAEPFYIGEFLGSYLCETRYTNGELRYVGRECLERQLSAVTAERDATRAENDTLKNILAESDLPCIYCHLPAGDMSKCRSGFPGCARADDLMCKPATAEKGAKE